MAPVHQTRLWRMGKCNFCRMQRAGKFNLYTSTKAPYSCSMSHPVACSGTPSVKHRTFSGIQPTGTIHLGNYLGAVQAWVNGINDKSENTRDQHLFSIVDLHAITLSQSPAALHDNIYSMAASLIACGLKPEKVLKIINRILVIKRGI